MEINRTNIMEIVNTTNNRPDKDYGQNFLIEPNICENIVESLAISNDDTVLEIGPGLGSLTHFILKKNTHLDIVDIDRRMINFLSVIYKDYSDLKIIENDIRKHNISTYTKIIGNLPYNITTELITYLLKEATNAKTLVLMCQLEAFDRVKDLDGKNYGPLSILAHLLGVISKVQIVKAGSFYPVPKCNSLVFKIELNNKYDKEKIFKTYSICKILFLNRRKTILNNLTNLLKNKDEALRILSLLNISINARPENIDYLSFYKMSELIH